MSNADPVDRRPWSRDEVQVTDPAAMRPAIIGTAIGNFVEWFDFGVYGYLATTLAQVFYPEERSGGIGLIATFGTMAAGFVVRPLGGLIFGLLGDRFGRKRLLVATILVMAAATTASGLLPSYAAIGAAAPLLLVTARVLQGLSSGGEYVGAMTYIDEQAPDRRRGQMAAFLPLGSWSGYVISAVLVTGLQWVLNSEQMLSWGWRVPFLLSAPLGLVTLYLRTRLGESQDYEQIEASEHVSGASGPQQFKQTVIQQWRPLLVCIGLVLTFDVTASVLAGYLPTYLRKVVHIGEAGGLVMLAVVLVVVASAVVSVAKLSDHIGVKPILWAGCGLTIAGAIPAFWLIRFGGSYPVVFAGVLLIGLMLLCFTSVEPSVLPPLFPTSVRYGALAIGFNISTSAFGGTTPLIAQTLISASGNEMVPAFMLIVAGVIGVGVLPFTPEVAGRRLPGSGPTVETEQAAREIAGGEGKTGTGPREES
jgi:MHS family proline/betaine transporter-like MFS transporter